MISFHRVTMEDMGWMRKILSEDGWYASEYSFGNNVLWGVKYKIEAALCHDCCIVRYDLADPESGKQTDERYIYSFPMGKGDKKAAVEEIMAQCRKDGRKLILNSVSEKGREQLLSWFPGRFLIEENRDYEDYIYDREKLATLNGRKMHNKRNHIARFKDAGEWSYEILNDNNEEECKKFCKRWVFSREDKWNEDMATEMKALMEGFKLRKKLGMVGGVLRQKGVIVAFCMGEEINPDVIDVHFEKALPEYQGAYPMINQQFAERACQKYKYINREDDTGDPGLRKSKLSYYPEILLKKYNAVLSDVVFADRTFHEEAIVSIWQTCFGDTKEFILDFLDRFMEEKTILLKYADGKPVSMACCLPVSIQQGEEDIPARYVYAVSTLPDYRGRGFAGEIISRAKKSFNEPLLLSPAEESLFSYYEKQGFSVISEIRDTLSEVSDADTLVSREQAEEELLPVNAEIMPVDAKTYKSLRDRLLCRDGYVKWDERAIGYALPYYGGPSGGALHVSGKDPGAEGIILYGCQKDTLQVIETSFSDEDCRKMLRALCGEKGIKKIGFHHPGAMIYVPENSRLFTEPKNMYFNLEFGD